MPLAEERDRVVAGYRSAADELSALAPPWLPALREAAIARFSELGFPSMKREDWKYTNVRPVARAVADAGSPSAAQASPDGLDSALDIAGRQRSLVFVDGRFDPSLSGTGDLPGDGVLDSLACVLRDRPDVALPLLDRPQSGEDRAFVALNSALQRDGAAVALPANAVIEEPIHLIFATTPAGAGQSFHLRNAISLGAGARAVIAIHHVGLGGEGYVANAVTDVTIGANASLELVTVERESDTALHLSTVSAELAADARLRCHFFSLGAALARNEVDVVLGGRGAESELFGLYAAGGSRHVDNQSTVDHAVPHCSSRQLYKGVLGGAAHGVFNGTVIVRPDAQKSDAQQQNANLLLSDGAEVDARPNLEIHADDVKCAHGSTVGRLDDDALFFLRARGIDRRSARQMLARAFAQELVAELPTDALRDEVGHRVGAVVAHLESSA